MNEVIKEDLRPPIIETIGEDGIKNEITLLCNQIAETTDREELTNAYNKLILCMDYLGIEADSVRQRIILYRWHDKLDRQGLEHSNKPKAPNFYDVRDKFLPPDWMANN